MSVRTLAVLKQYRHQVYSIGARSAAEGKNATTINPISGEQISDNPNQNIALRPFLSAKLPTRAASNVHTNAVPATMRKKFTTREFMAHPRVAFFMRTGYAALFSALPLPVKSAWQ